MIKNSLIENMLEGNKYMNEQNNELQNEGLKFNYEGDTIEVICQVEMPEKEPVDLSRIIPQLTKSKGGLYPHEILMLSRVSKYQVNTYDNDFNWFWKDRYGIENPLALINKLLNQGFVGIEDTKAAMFRLTIPKIKELLKEYSCDLTGKKAELIDRLYAEGNIGTIESKLPPRRYCLTDLGKKEIEREENEYIIFISRKASPISIYEMNILLYKNNPLNLSYKDFIWKKYLEDSEEELLLHFISIVFSSCSRIRSK